MLFKYCLFVYLSCCCFANGTPQQEPSFEIPVQLIGFPVIIAAVRITNFLRKLSYSLNPETYVSRTKRYSQRSYLDLIEKRFNDQFDDKFCIYEHLCVKYANRRHAIEWHDIAKELSPPVDDYNNYLTSMYLGNFFNTTEHCRQLSRRKGRSC